MIVIISRSHQIVNLIVPRNVFLIDRFNEMFSRSVLTCDEERQLVHMFSKLTSIMVFFAIRLWCNAVKLIHLFNLVWRLLKTHAIDLMCGKNKLTIANRTKMKNFLVRSSLEIFIYIFDVYCINKNSICIRMVHLFIWHLIKPKRATHSAICFSHDRTYFIFSLMSSSFVVENYSFLTMFNLLREQLEKANINLTDD